MREYHEISGPHNRVVVLSRLVELLRGEAGLALVGGERAAQNAKNV